MGGNSTLDDFFITVENPLRTSYLLLQALSVVVLCGISSVCCCRACWRAFAYEFDFIEDRLPISEESLDKYGIKPGIGMCALLRALFIAGWSLVGNFCQIGVLCSCGLYVFMLAMYAALPPTWIPSAWLWAAGLVPALAIPTCCLMKLVSALVWTFVVAPFEARLAKADQVLHHMVTEIRKDTSHIVHPALEFVEQAKHDAAELL